MGKISLEVNGRKVEKEAPDNTLLSTFTFNICKRFFTHLCVHRCRFSTSVSK